MTHEPLVAQCRVAREPRDTSSIRIDSRIQMTSPSDRQPGPPRSAWRRRNLRLRAMQIDYQPGRFAEIGFAAKFRLPCQVPPADPVA